MVHDPEQSYRANLIQVALATMIVCATAALCFAALFTLLHADFWPDISQYPQSLWRVLSYTLPLATVVALITVGRALFWPLHVDGESSTHASWLNKFQGQRTNEEFAQSVRVARTLALAGGGLLLLMALIWLLQLFDLPESYTIPGAVSLLAAWLASGFLQILVTTRTSLARLAQRTALYSGAFGTVLGLLI